MLIVRLSFMLLLQTCLMTATSCNYEMPTNECYQTIPWKAKTVEEAQSVCTDYFPTNFITATKTESEITCHVKSGYMCTDPGAVVIYDKCIKFDTTERKIGEATDCDEMAAPYSYKHFSFIGKAASRKGIKKIWVGMTADGKAYKNKKKMLIKELWKAGKSAASKTSIIFHTRNDYVQGKIAGSFEYVDGNEKAAHACVKEAFFNADQQWYCEKMKHLGFSTVYDSKMRKCLYTTTLSYKFKSPEDINNIDGCKENPYSNIHSSNMDNGEGDPSAYLQLDPIRTLRIAGFAADFVKNVQLYAGQYKDHVRVKCDPKDVDVGESKFHRLKWRIYGHFGEEKPVFSSSIPWQDKEGANEKQRPMNECSSFPGDAKTIAVRKGKKIDVPSEVRLRAICSIKMFSQCKILSSKKKATCKPMQECTDSVTFNRNNNIGMLMDGFFTCKCPEHHTEQSDGTCKWNHEPDYCAWFYSYKETNEAGVCKSPASCGDKFLRTDQDNRNREYFKALPKFHDEVFKAVVRPKCHLTMQAHPVGTEEPINPRTVEDAQYGTHTVPNHDKKTVDHWGLSASSYSCHCED